MASTTLTTYSPKDVIVSIAGLHTVGGMADGTFLRIIKESRPFEKGPRSMDGEISRIYNPDDCFKIELSLMQSSGSNDILTMLYNVDVATRMGKFPMIITDGNGNTSFVAATAWVEQIPEVSYSNQLELRTWTLGACDVVFTIGGNEAQSVVEEAISLGAAALPLLSQFF